MEEERTPLPPLMQAQPSADGRVLMMPSREALLGEEVETLKRRVMELEQRLSRAEATCSERRDRADKNFLHARKAAGRVARDMTRLKEYLVEVDGAWAATGRHCDPLQDIRHRILGAGTLLRTTYPTPPTESKTPRGEG